MEAFPPSRNACISGQSTSGLTNLKNVSSRSQRSPEDALSPLVTKDAYGGPWENISHIILPSRSMANDKSRKQNLGRPKAANSGKLPRPSSGHSRLRRSTSAPSLPCSTCIAMLDPNTPRSKRGLIRRASKTSISYPSLPVYVNANDLNRCRRSGSKPPVPSHNVGARPSSAPPGKRVSFTDEAEFREPAAQALRRSKTLLKCLYHLRRAGRGNGISESKDDHAQGKDETPLVEDTLMNATLCDINDDSTTVQTTLSHLEDARDPVHDAGGSRHASTLVAGRTLGVVKRKLFLVQSLEKRLAEFRKAMEESKGILSELVADNGDPPLLKSLLAVPQFLRSFVHKDGQPIDADKTDFEAFLASFGLPSKHHHVISLKRLAEEATDWWAAEALREADSGSTSADTIRRILAVASGINGNHNHKAMQDCHAILTDRLANEVLALAEKLQKKDAEVAKLSKEVQPQSAKDAAMQINNEITAAAKHGASPKHPSMEKAKTIANILIVEEKKRYALRALRFAQTAQARDLESAKQAPDGVPEVGPASEQADLIEKEINRALNLGAAETDQSIKDAHSIAKSLRDADGERKRLKSRQKRLTSTTASA